MADDEVDDYMTMVFDDDAAAKPKESSLQRRIRLQRERRERGHQLSKAELARAAEAERKAALNRSLFERVGGGGASSNTSTSKKDPARPAPGSASKGFAMMARMGFVVGQPLGKRRDGDRDDDAGAPAPAAATAGPAVVDERLTEPIPLQVKRGRAGLGAGAGDGDADDDDDGGPDARKRVKGTPATPLPAFDPLAYRDRIAQEREAARLERIVHAAQVVARRMAAAAAGTEDEADEKDDSDLLTVNVLWRGLVRDRRVAERERRLRHQSRQLLDTRLRGTGTGSGEAGEEEDDDDRLARGKGPAQSFLDGGLRTEIRDDDDDDDDDDGDGDKEDKDDDTELAAFEALPARERLQQIVDWLRTEHRYCFWCKCAYPDAAMDGCPGRTEEDHD